MPLALNHQRTVSGAPLKTRDKAGTYERNFLNIRPVFFLKAKHLAADFLKTAQICQTRDNLGTYTTSRTFIRHKYSQTMTASPKKPYA